jgi:hypothetical protein
MKRYLLDSYDGDSILLIDDMSEGAYRILEHFIGKIQINKEPYTVHLGYRYYIEFPTHMSQLVLEQLHIMDFKRQWHYSFLKDNDNRNSAFEQRK